MIRKGSYTSSKVLASSDIATANDSKPTGPPPNFSTTKKFDIYLSKPTTGILPQHAIKEKMMTRTLQPMTSFIVRGKCEEEVKGLSCTTVWGKDSIMEWIEKKDAIWCAFGVPWSIGCAFFHRAEEIMRVPYRYYKKYYAYCGTNNCIRHLGC